MSVFEKGIAIWFVAIAAGGIGLYASNLQPNHAVATPINVISQKAKDLSQSACDSADAVATIKNMALEKINDGYNGEKLISVYSRKYLGKKPARWVSPRIIVDSFSLEDVTMDSFRNQGNIGTGSRCAAQIGVEVSGKRAPSEISVEYTIEPTTDGKTMVSARFRQSS